MARWEEEATIKTIGFKEKQNLPFYLANDHIFIHTVIIKALEYLDIYSILTVNIQSNVIQLGFFNLLQYKYIIQNLY